MRKQLEDAGRQEALAFINTPVLSAEWAPAHLGSSIAAACVRESDLSPNLGILWCCAVSGNEAGGLVAVCGSKAIVQVRKIEILTM